MQSSTHIEEMASRVLDAAFAVHSALGPGLLETSYETCLAHEFRLRAIPHERQLPLPVTYHGERLDAGYRLDFLVDRQIILEIKSVETVIPLHKAQLLTYLKLSGHTLGFILNFNVIRMKHGVQRIVLSHPAASHASQETDLPSL